MFNFLAALTEKSYKIQTQALYAVRSSARLQHLRDFKSTSLQDANTAFHRGHFTQRRHCYTQKNRQEKSRSDAICHQQVLPLTIKTIQNLFTIAKFCPRRIPVILLQEFFPQRLGAACTLHPALGSLSATVRQMHRGPSRGHANQSQASYPSVQHRAPALCSKLCSLQKRQKLFHFLFILHTCVCVYIYTQRERDIYICIQNTCIYMLLSSSSFYRLALSTTKLGQIRS